MSNSKVFASTLGTVSVLIGGMYIGNYGFAARKKRYKDEDLPTERKRRKIFDEVATTWDYKVSALLASSCQHRIVLVCFVR